MTPTVVHEGVFHCAALHGLVPGTGCSGGGEVVRRHRCIGWGGLNIKMFRENVRQLLQQQSEVSNWMLFSCCCVGSAFHVSVFDYKVSTPG